MINVRSGVEASQRLMQQHGLEEHPLVFDLAAHEEAWGVLQEDHGKPKLSQVHRSRTALSHPLGRDGPGQVMGWLATTPTAKPLIEPGPSAGPHRHRVEASKKSPSSTNREITALMSYACRWLVGTMLRIPSSRSTP